MTVVSSDRSVVYTGNGSATTFDYGFKIYVASHVVVSLLEIATGDVTVLTDSQYSITGVGYTGTGGTVTYPLSGSPLASTHKIFIERTVPYTQQQAISNQAGYRPETVERSLDLLAMQVQQLSDGYENRALRIPNFETAITAIPNAVDRAGNLLAFDVAGEPVMYSPVAPIGPADKLSIVSTKTALKAVVSPALSSPIYLNVDGSAGVFRHTTDDLSADVTVDTGEIITMPALSGYWVKSGTRAIGLARDAGAVPDGATDTTQELKDAIKLAAHKDLPVMIDGRFLVSERIAYAGAYGPSIHGQGANISRLTWTDAVANAGFNYTLSNQLAQPEFSNFSMATQTKATGTAFWMQKPGSASNSFPGPKFHNLEFWGDDINNDCWDYVLDLTNCWNTRASGLVGYGRTFTLGEEVLGSAGIRTANCSDSKFSNFYFQGFDMGCDFGAAAGDDEGIQATDFTLISVNQGIRHNTPLAEAGCNFSRGHINAYQVGLNLFAKHNGFISMVDIYKITGATADFNAVALQNCENMNVDNITFIDSGTSGTNYMLYLVDAVNRCKFSNFRTSLTQNANYAIGFAGTGNSYNDFTSIDNLDLALLNYITPMSNHIGNKFLNVWPCGETIFTANDTTPSVGIGPSPYFQTANSGATTITTFDDTYEGQEWWVFVNDANTTIAHSAGLILKGGVNAVVPNGGFMHFRRFPTLIREVGERNF